MGIEGSPEPADKRSDEELADEFGDEFEMPEIEESGDVEAVEDEDMADEFDDEFEMPDAEEEIDKEEEAKNEVEKIVEKNLAEPLGDKLNDPELERKKEEEMARMESDMDDRNAKKKKLDRGRSVMADAERNAAGVRDPKEKAKVQAAILGRSIKRSEKNLQNTVVSSVYKIDDGTAIAQRRAAAKKRAVLRKDLSSLPSKEGRSGVMRFYKKYSKILEDTNDVSRNKKVDELKMQLALDLNALHGGEEYYSPAEIDEIFRTLTAAEQVQEYATMIFIERLQMAYEVDAELGTDLAGSVSDLMDSGLPPDEILNRMDRAFHDIAMLALKLEIISLERLAEAEARSRSAEQAADEKSAGFSLRALSTESTVSVVVTEVAKLLPNPEQADERQQMTDALQEHAENGRSEVVDMLLQHPDKLKPTPDGGYAGEVEGETVVLTRSPSGVLDAHFTVNGEQIRIPNTDPAAVGFDLAFSQVSVIRKKRSELVNRPQLLSMLMDNPYDAQFMEKGEAGNFGSMMENLFLEGGDVDKRLTELNMTKNGTLDEFMVYAVKEYIKVKAQGTSMAAVVLAPGELKKFTDKCVKEGIPARYQKP